MLRDLRALSDSTFDLVVIGGGVFGAAAAWEAVQRGLSVALIERADFASYTSANSYKVVHGGIRYIQHGDVYRIRQSAGERSAFLRIAPHLVRPLPIAIPTYGYGMKGKAAFASWRRRLRPHHGRPQPRHRRSRPQNSIWMVDVQAGDPRPLSESTCRRSDRLGDLQ